MDSDRIVSRMKLLRALVAGAPGQKPDRHHSQILHGRQGCLSLPTKRRILALTPVFAATIAGSISAVWTHPGSDEIILSSLEAIKVASSKPLFPTHVPLFIRKSRIRPRNSYATLHYPFSIDQAPKLQKNPQTPPSYFLILHPIPSDLSHSIAVFRLVLQLSHTLDTSGPFIIHHHPQCLPIDYPTLPPRAAAARQYLSTA